MAFCASRSVSARSGAGLAVASASAVAFDLVGVHGFGFDEDARRVAIVLGTAIVIVASSVATRWVCTASVVALGASANLLVILVNGGGMPIETGLAAEITGQRVEELQSQGGLLHESKDIPLDREDIRLYAFADRIEVQLPVPGRNVYSVGDAILAAGLLLAGTEVVARSTLSRRPPEGVA